MRLTQVPLSTILLPILLLVSLPISTAQPTISPRSSDLVQRDDSSSSSSAIVQAIEAFFSALAAAFSPQSSSGSGSGASATASATSTSGSGGSGHGTAASSGTGSGTGLAVYYQNCADGSNVTQVQIEGCEGGTGAEGSPCVFTQGNNYTITITFTSPSDIAQAQARTGLASYDGDAETAYSGQSFSACTYTSCPIQAGVQATYTYPFRTYAAPKFDRLVFNATNSISGPSVMCASIPVTFQASS